MKKDDYKYKISILVVIVLVVLALYLFYLHDIFMIDNSIKNGLNYLDKSQAENGDFPILECDFSNFTNCNEEDTIFAAAYILMSLNDIQNEKSTKIRKNLVKYILDNKLENNVWKFWSKQDTLKYDPNNELVPDRDDTTIALLALMMNSVELESKDFFDRNFNNKGLYYTYDMNTTINNPIDCAVNAKILIYLSIKNKNQEKLCNYLNMVIGNEEYNHCSYYFDEFGVIEALSRAIDNPSITCLKDKKQKLTSYIRSKQNPDGSFGNDFSTSIAINSLIKLGYRGSVLKKSVKNLISRQNNDGSWDYNQVFMSPGNVDPLLVDEGKTFYFFSKDMVTASSIEALHNYKNIIKSKFE